MRLRDVLLGLLLLSIVPPLPAGAPGSKKDFVLTPPIPPEAVPPLKKPVKGTLQIVYQDGKITSVKVQATTGDKKLDAIAVRHVQEKYQVRPGASGAVNLPFLLNGVLPPGVTVSNKSDFTSAPVLNIPRESIPYLPKPVRSSAVIHYENGKLTQIDLMKSTGNRLLDKLILHHVMLNFKVKPGTTGKSMLPIGIRL